MGAWGAGMQANDSAGDAVNDFERAVTHRHIMLGGKEALEKYFQQFFPKRWKREPYHWTAWGALGVAEFMMDLGLRHRIPASVKKLLKAAVMYELQALEGWRSSAARKRALENFRDRLLGKGVDLKQIERDNSPLFSQIRRRRRQRRKKGKLPVGNVKGGKRTLRRKKPS